MTGLRDRQVITIVIACLFLYAAAAIAGLLMHRFLLFAAAINALTGMVLIGYWIWDKLRPLLRKTETRELVVLFAEGVFVALAIRAIICNPLTQWLVIVQYSIFAVHAILLALFLIFLCTYKIKKLF